jgi:hypothetical protein
VAVAAPAFGDDDDFGTVTNDATGANRRTQG